MHLNRSPTLILLTVVIGLSYDQLAFVGSIKTCHVCESHWKAEKTSEKVDPLSTCASPWVNGNDNSNTFGKYAWKQGDCQLSANTACMAVQTRNTKLWSNGEYTLRECGYIDAKENVDLSQLNKTGGACVDVKEYDVDGSGTVPARICYCADADSCNKRLEVSPRSTTNGPSSATPNGQSSTRSSQPDDGSSNPSAPTAPSAATPPSAPTSASKPSDATTKASNSEGPNIGLIAGIAVGCALLAGIVGFFAYKKLSGGGDKGSVDEGGEEEAKVSL